MNTTKTKSQCGGFVCADMTAHEKSLLETPLPNPSDANEAAKLWDQYQEVINGLMVRMGKENAKLDSVARLVLVRNLGGLRTRISLIPTLGRSTLHLAEKHKLSELVYRLAGEFSLMELSAAAGYRTFCFPMLVRGLVKSGKMQGQSITRMIDTFEFLKTMFLHPYHDPRVVEQFDRTNGLHGKYKVAGAHNEAARDLFKYIALNMFYIGPSMRPDLTLAERHAILGLTVLVSNRMYNPFTGTVMELESFIRDYEADEMFSRDDDSELKERAIEIAKASKVALDEVPTISPARIHGYVPERVKQILAI